MERNNMSKKIRALIYVLLAFIANFILQFFVVIGMTVARPVFLKNISDDNFMVLTNVGYSIVAAVVGIVVLIVMKRMEQKKKLEYGAMGYGRQDCDQKEYDQQKDGTTECARQTCDDTYSDSRCLAYEKRYGVFKDTLKLLLFGIILQGFVYCILNLSYQVFGNTALFKNYAELISNLNGSKSLYIYIYTMFFAPISEEILFRGIVMKLAKKGGSYMFANVPAENIVLPTSVKEIDYEDELLVDQPEPLISYILSCHGNQHEYLNHRYLEFKDFVRKKMAAKGVIKITKSAGIFICQP